MAEEKVYRYRGQTMRVLTVERCYDCPWCDYTYRLRESDAKFTDVHECIRGGRQIEDGETIPKWCPLPRPMKGSLK